MPLYSLKKAVTQQKRRATALKGGKMKKRNMSLRPHPPKKNKCLVRSLHQGEHLHKHLDASSPQPDSSNPAKKSKVHLISSAGKHFGVVSAV